MNKTVITEEIISYIPANTTIKGTINAKHKLVIQGVVDGNVNCEQTLQLEKDATVKGDVVCNDFYCEGLVEGNVKVKNNCELCEGAVINGTVECATLYSSFNSIIEKGLKLKK